MATYGVFNDLFSANLLENQPVMLSLGLGLKTKFFGLGLES